MSNSEAPSDRRGASAGNTGFGCFLQIVTGLGGFFFLVILTVLILRGEPWTFTIKDALFWIVVASMIVARSLEVTRFESDPKAAHGSTSWAVTRYAAPLLLVAAIAWAGAQAWTV